MEGGGVWEAAPEGAEGGEASKGKKCNPWHVRRASVCAGVSLKVSLEAMGWCERHPLIALTQTLTPTPTLTLLERAAECRHPTAVRRWARPPCGHIKIQSCCSLGSVSRWTNLGPNPGAAVASCCKGLGRCCTCHSLRS
jgi:hypothetical protein